MKKAYIYLILFNAFVLFTLGIFHFRKNDTQFTVQMRQGEAATAPDWQNAKVAIQNLIDILRSNPENDKAKLSLGYAYIQESRESGNHSYYDKAALELFDNLLKKNPEDFEALTGKATVLLSQHHFSDAIPIAQEAIKINPYSSSSYGVLTDAYVETGEYDEAVKMADKMVSIRPDMRSYSRVSYLREILGNNKGAVAAMQLAVEAGYPGNEQTEWSRVQLGHLYENTGDLQKAEFEYQKAVYYRPSFAYGYAGLGRIQKAKNNYNQAIQLFQRAGSLVPDYSFSHELMELYRITNQQVKASVEARKEITILAGLDGNQSSTVHGHYADRELAFAYLDCYDYNSALTHALTEYNRRPKNIDVNQTLAWVYYKTGKYDFADEYIDVALKTHSQNPVLLYEAGLIKCKSGKSAEGNQLISSSLSLDPFISPLLRWEHPSSDLALK